MEQLMEIDLFADTLPTIENITQLSGLVNSSQSNIAKFSEQVENTLSKKNKADCLAVGIGLYILGKNQQAIEQFTEAEDRKEKFLFTALAHKSIRQFDQAIENLQKSLDFQADSLAVSLQKASVYRAASNFEDAQKELNKCANFENVSAEYHYQLARVQQSQGLYAEAVENYKKSIELSPEHQKAIFQLAYRCDMAGDEQAAIDYYKQIISTNPVYVSALLNLAVLYEDAEEYEKAGKCIDKVLEYHPNHERARLFKKDIDSSKTMFYDEDKEKTKDRKNQILETPISDFELSVRSRNCLKKMRINTLGDLLRISEAELLSYKNFGETSLKEIKTILESRNLRLGMLLEETQHITEVGINEYDQQVNGEENTELLTKPVEDLQLSVRARKCVERLNIRIIGELTRHTEAELLGCKNFGVTSLNEIKKALGSMGLALRELD